MGGEIKGTMALAVAIGLTPFGALADTPTPPVQPARAAVSPPLQRAPLQRAKTFGPETAPRWIVAATTPSALPSPSRAVPPKRWRPDKRWAVTPTVGADGVGGDLSFQATRSLVIRARGAWLSARKGETYDRIHYSGRLKLTTGGAFVDVHPAPGWMHPLLISVGMIKGQRRLSILAEPQGALTLAGHTYTAAQFGTVAGAVRLPDTAPFLGVGWDNTFDSHGPFGVRLVAGAVVSGRPEVDLNSVGGSLSLAQTLQADLAAERAKIKDAADYLRVYPVVSTGLSFKF